MSSTEANTRDGQNVAVVHDRLEDSPKTRQSVSGRGWTTVLSGLKTLLETGTPLFAVAATA